MFRFIATGALVATGFSLSAHAWTQPAPKPPAPPPKPQEELTEITKTPPSTYLLGYANSTISIPEGYQTIAIPNKFGVVVHDDSYKNFIFFKSCNCGYVPLDDGSNLDPKALIDAISQDIKKSIQGKQEQLGIELRSVVWIQEPILDRQTNTAHFAYRIDDNQDRNIIHSTVVHFGRECCVHITWMGPLRNYTEDTLNLIAERHHFIPGYRYEDYTPGDKVADHDLATILAFRELTK